mmetsp:Transcript_29178/g.93781  ORF Transcript_29178/g.93781 Transcript_29178/m.93781 type:complete len:211 (+) Transcript_29178:991-1623(+)
MLFFETASALFDLSSFSSTISFHDIEGCSKTSILLGPFASRLAFTNVLELVLLFIAILLASACGKLSKIAAGASGTVDFSCIVIPGCAVGSLDCFALVKELWSEERMLSLLFITRFRTVCPSVRSSSVLLIISCSMSTLDVEASNRGSEPGVEELRSKKMGCRGCFSLASSMNRMLAFAACSNPATGRCIPGCSFCCCRRIFACCSMRGS